MWCLLRTSVFHVRLKNKRSDVVAAKLVGLLDPEQRVIRKLKQGAVRQQPSSEKLMNRPDTMARPLVDMPDGE